MQVNQKKMGYDKISTQSLKFLTCKQPELRYICTRGKKAKS
jgi:hypothetical protein